LSEPTVIEEEQNAFEDSDVLIFLRGMIADAITSCTDSKETGNSGCGMGSADIEFELEGLKFTVSISLSGDDEVEH
jgi:hypothetical protein